MTSLQTTEYLRTEIQRGLDAASTQAERNVSGRFATPPGLASAILEQTLDKIAGQMPQTPALRFLDPAAGTGTFYSALLSATNPGSIASACGYELHPTTAAAATTLWAPLGLTVRQQDFTNAPPPPPGQRFDLVVCNPPYVRHHHIPQERKRELRERLEAQGNMQLDGLAGLYAHFIGLAHPWMADGALACWLVPGEFMDTRYGKGVRDYLTARVTLLRIHRFDPADPQFPDALVSSVIVWLRNRPPPPGHTVRLTQDGTLSQPARDKRVSIASLRTNPKWSATFQADTVNCPAGIATLSDFFRIRRGIATGNNRFFVLTEQQTDARNIPLWALTPLLPPPRNLQTDVVPAGPGGAPDLPQRLFLLDTNLDEQAAADLSPSLAAYLQEGRRNGVDQGYLSLHRTPWYSQEKRPTPPFVCTYMGRARKNSSKSPFRFILNHSGATVLNTYLAMYPHGPLAKRLEEDGPELKTRIWEGLRQIDHQQLALAGRTYGGGLRKLEPRELGSVAAAPLVEMLAA